jgi:hypothetical protein
MGFDTVSFSRGMLLDSRCRPKGRRYKNRSEPVFSATWQRSALP